MKCHTAAQQAQLAGCSSSRPQALAPCRELGSSSSSRQHQHQRHAAAAGQQVRTQTPLPLEPVRRRMLVLPSRASADPDEVHENKLGPNVAAGIKDVKEGLTWKPATVIRNEGVNLSGTHRLLHMSVSDEVDMVYGRKIQAVAKQVRWLESFTVPGQFVGVRLTGQGGSDVKGLADNQQLYSIACSPYESRRDSAYIGGSIIEVVVDKAAGGEQAVLADMTPGSSVEVSQVVGRGFASLFNSYCGLPSSLEEQRNILALAVGLKGIAAIRSVLSWAPVQAHATSHRVTAYYVTKNPSSAAFLAEWDQWREAGVQFNPLYTETLQQRSGSPGDAPPLPANGSSGASSSGTTNGGGASVDSEQVSVEDIMVLLEQGLFLHEHGLESVIGGKASEVTVLLAGIPSDIASTVAKELTFKGVAWERLLFCDYF